MSSPIASEQKLHFRHQLGLKKQIDLQEFLYEGSGNRSYIDNISVFDDQYFYWIFQNDDEVISCVSLHTNSSYITFIKNCLTHSEYQRKGYMKLLFKYVLSISNAKEFYIQVYSQSTESMAICSKKMKQVMQYNIDPLHNKLYWILFKFIKNC